MARKTVYNNIVNDETWKQVSADNKSLMEEFVAYLKSLDKSTETIKQYVNDLKIFFVWNLLNNNNKFFINFSKRDVIKYQNYLIHDLGQSSARVRRLKSSISSMSNFIERVMDEDYPNFRNIINKIPAPDKQVVREKTVFSEDQMKELLDYLVENKKYQQACALALAMSSGSRKAEMLRFKVSYFDKSNIQNGLYKTPEKIKTKGRSSKGKMIHRYVLASQFTPYLELWLNQREELGITGDELFYVKRNNEWIPANISTLDSWALSFSKFIKADFYWHSLRHYFTTLLCKSGIPASVIKDIIGWESTNMIDIYNDLEVDDELGRYFSDDGIKDVEQKGLSEL